MHEAVLRCSCWIYSLRRAQTFAVIALQRTRTTAHSPKPSNTLHLTLSKVKFVGSLDLLVDSNLLVLKLLYHGATFKNIRNEKDYKWAGVDTLVSYLSTRRHEALEMLSTNRHRKCATTK